MAADGPRARRLGCMPTYEGTRRGAAACEEVFLRARFTLLKWGAKPL